MIRNDGNVLIRTSAVIHVLYVQSIRIVFHRMLNRVVVVDYIVIVVVIDHVIAVLWRLCNRRWLSIFLSPLTRFYYTWQAHFDYISV